MKDNLLNISKILMGNETYDKFEKMKIRIKNGEVGVKIEDEIDELYEEIMPKLKNIRQVDKVFNNMLEEAEMQNKELDFGISSLFVDIVTFSRMKKYILDKYQNAKNSIKLNNESWYKYIYEKVGFLSGDIDRVIKVKMYMDDVNGSFNKIYKMFELSNDDSEIEYSRKRRLIRSIHYHQTKLSMDIFGSENKQTDNNLLIINKDNKIAYKTLINNLLKLWHKYKIPIEIKTPGQQGFINYLMWEFDTYNIITRNDNVKRNILNSLYKVNDLVCWSREPMKSCIKVIVNNSNSKISRTYVINSASFALGYISELNTDTLDAKITYSLYEMGKQKLYTDQINLLNNFNNNYNIDFNLCEFLLPNEFIENNIGIIQAKNVFDLLHVNNSEAYIPEGIIEYVNSIDWVPVNDSRKLIV